MDFITNMMGLLLLLVCIVIVLIFLKDFARLGKASVQAAGEGSKSIAYEICYKGRRLKEGVLTAEQLPVQFGREKGGGNDIAVAPTGIPEAARQAVSRAWFYIQKDISEELVIYSAEPSVNGEKKPSGKKKLVIDEDGELRVERSVKLDSEITLKAEQLTVQLRVRKDT